jgi:FMN phosphatase YigB (HAD superfamily)
MCKCLMYVCVCLNVWFKVLFLDDEAANVEGAKQMGMHAHQYNDADD